MVINPVSQITYLDDFNSSLINHATQMIWKFFNSSFNVIHFLVKYSSFLKNMRYKCEAERQQSIHIKLDTSVPIHP